MHYTIERLLRGDASIAPLYRAAGEKWKEILSATAVSDTESLASRLLVDQLAFEKIADSRWLGQEVMVVSGLLRSYTTQTGFGDPEEAHQLYQAIRASGCSLEVKSTADEIARMFRIISDD